MARVARSKQRQQQQLNETNEQKRKKHPVLFSINCTVIWKTLVSFNDAAFVSRPLSTPAVNVYFQIIHRASRFWPKIQFITTQEATDTCHL